METKTIPLKSLVLSKLIQLSPDYSQTDNQYRFRANPFRPGSDSDSFVVTFEDDDHGAFFDHVTKDGGSLYELAERLGIGVNPHSSNGYKAHKDTGVYANLEEYAAAHGVTADVFISAQWNDQVTHMDRPALPFRTRNGVRYRFIDGKKPKYISPKKYDRCWYGLERAVNLAKETGQPLIICNGEASTVVAQYFGIAACCVTAGEHASLPDNLLIELKAVWQGEVDVIFDCDQAGRESSPKLADQLRGIGFEAEAIELNLGFDGEDLADLCRLHRDSTIDHLRRCKPISQSRKKTAREKRKAKTSADYMAALASLGYMFKMNACNDELLVNDQRISDPIRATIRTKMRDMGYNRHLSAVEDAYIAYAYTNQFHPVKDYLTGLKWDGKPNIEGLAIFFNDMDNVFSRWLTAWLVGSVAKVFEAEQNYMLVLDGRQGLGKSHFVEWLGSPLGPDYCIEEPINPDDKDNAIRLMSKWIWEVGELGSTFRRADREALKFFITRRTVTVRPSYGRSDITKPAMANLIGTVNNEAGFLNDPTGSRRFLTCELTAIDWNYAKLDINQIWAEAYHKYKSGFQWKLDPGGGKLQQAINDRYRVDSHVLGMFHKYFDYTADPANPNFALWKPAADIIQHLEAYGLKGQQKSLSMELAGGLKELGIEKAKKNNVWSYRGVFERISAKA